MKPGAVLLIVAAFGAAACNPMSDASHMQEMSAMKDSIFKAYPNVGAVTINIQDRELLIVTLGSKGLSRVDGTRRTAIAGNIGAMALRMMGSNSGLKREKLILTPNERNDVAEPADGVVTALSLDSLAGNR